MKIAYVFAAELARVFPQRHDPAVDFHRIRNLDLLVLTALRKHYK